MKKLAIGMALAAVCGMVQAETHFKGDVERRFSCHFSHNPLNDVGVWHQTAAARMAHHRRRRATDIDVKVIVTKLFIQHPYRIHKLFRTVAHQLRNKRQSCVVFGDNILPDLLPVLAGGLCRQKRSHKTIYAAKVTA